MLSVHDGMKLNMCRCWWESRLNVIAHTQRPKRSNSSVLTQTGLHKATRQRFRLQLQASQVHIQLQTLCENQQKELCFRSFGCIRIQSRSATVGRLGPGTKDVKAYSAIWKVASDTRSQNPSTSKGCIASRHVHSTRPSKVNGTRAKQKTVLTVQLRLPTKTR